MSKLGQGCGLCVLLLFSANATAAPSSNGPQSLGGDVTVQAEGDLEIDLKSKIARVQGNVVLRRKDVVVCCDKAVAHYEGGDVQRVDCRGRVVVKRTDGTVAHAELATLNLVKDQLSFSGNARLQKGADNLAGDAIIYDIAKDTLKVRGGRPTLTRSKAAQVPAGRPCPPKTKAK